jgi:hypothetical protein
MLDAVAVVVGGTVRQRHQEERSLRVATSQKREGGGAVLIPLYPSCIREYWEGSLG